MRLAPGAQERHAFRIMEYAADIVERDADAKQLLGIRYALFTRADGAGCSHIRFAKLLPISTVNSRIVQNNGRVNHFQKNGNGLD